MHPSFGLELASSFLENFQNRQITQPIVNECSFCSPCHLLSECQRHTQRGGWPKPLAARCPALRTRLLRHTSLVWPTRYFAVSAHSLISLLWMLSRASETVQVDDRARATCKLALCCITLSCRVRGQQGYAFPPPAHHRPLSRCADILFLHCEASRAHAAPGVWCKLQCTREHS